MKKSILLVLMFSLVGLYAHAGKDKKQSKGYEIKVKVNNMTDSLCYLAYHLGDKKYVRDTTVLDKKGYYTFSGSEPLPGGIYIVYFESKKNFEIIVSEQFFTVETDTNDFIKNFKTEDSKENKVFYDYLQFTGEINNKAIPLSEELKDINKKLADPDLSESERERLTKRKEEITNILKGYEADIKSYREKIFKEHADLYVTKTFKAVEEIVVPEDVPDKEKFYYYRSHYFDFIDLKDDRLMRTPILEKKVNYYLEKLTVQDPDSVITAADYLVSQTSPNSELLKFMIITVTNKYSASKIMCMDKVYIHMIKKYYETGISYWADSAQVAKLSERAQTLSWTSCGTQTPNLMKLQDTSGIFRELYRQPAEYTILYFWDPDCGHCKKATPKLVEAYNSELKAMGIRIYAVATTKDKAKWIKFINDKGMREWINVYDPDHVSPFRQWYDVTSTPRLYITDKRKKIIARQLGVEQVTDFMKQHIRVQEQKKAAGTN